MRILLIFLFALFISSETFSQTFIPFPSDSVIWTDGSQSVQSPCSPALACCSWTDYLIVKDTLIANLIYHKLLAFDHSHKGCGNPNFSQVNHPQRAAGFFRNDSVNQKVWYRSSSSLADSLLYDFDLQVGSQYPTTYLTANLGVTYIVDSIKQGIYYGQNRNEYYLSDSSSGLQKVVLIEGIGGSSGFLNPIVWEWI